MTDPFQFADKLGFYVNRSAYTSGQLASLSDLPKTTIANWLNGRVQRPRDWQPIVKLLTVLHLDENEADEILRAAHQPTIAELRLLAQEQDQSLLMAWERPSTTPAPTYRPPFQAIADLPFFVGRQSIQADITTSLLNSDGLATSVLQGMAGTGKTALAARIAYELRPHFGDGVLWARLDTSSTMMILHTFAQAYGADVSQYDDIDSRSRVVRDLLSDKRVLIVLDNATNSAAVEPLLPPTGQCAVLITTRRHDLRVAQGVNRFTLTPFQVESASTEQLFSHYLGEERVKTDVDELVEIADHVGHLPLALAIIAGRLAYEPGWSSAEFLARLKQASSERLNELQNEDQNVRFSFAASYGLAPDDVQSFFATLSFFGGKDFSPEAAAAAGNVPLALSQDYLRMLYRLSLVQLGRVERYQLHPLLSDYAAERLPKTAVWAPLANYYIDFLTGCNLGDPKVLVESDNILAVITGALENEETAVSVELLITFAPFLKMQGIYAEAQWRLEKALDLAQDEQRLPILLHLSQTARYYRRFDEAGAYLVTADALAQAQQNLTYLSTIEAEKGIIAGCRGDHEKANEHFSAGLTLARQLNSPSLLISLLKELGASEVALRKHEAAESHYQEALALAEQTSPAHVPRLLRCLAGIAIGRDQNYALAGTLYEAGLRKARTMNNQEDIVFLLNNLAAVAFQVGQMAKATDFLNEGLALARVLLHKAAIGMILSNLGRIAAHEQKWVVAQHYLEEGLKVATAVNLLEMIPALHTNLGLLAGRQFRFQEAEGHFQEAIDRSKEIGSRQGILQALVGWSWLSAQQKAADVPSRYLAVYRDLDTEYHFRQSPEEFGAPSNLAFIERPKVVYD